MIEDDNLNSKIEIRAVPRFGSLKESIELSIKSTKESLEFQKRLAKESGKYFFKTTWRALRSLNLVKNCVQKGETPTAFPDITEEGKKFWAFRYGLPFYKVGRLGIPTGYTVLNGNNKIVTDIELACHFARLYRIWEEVYIRPYTVPRTTTIKNWLLEFENKLYKSILKRMQNDYEDIKGSKEELKALKELDQEVVDFHEVKIQLLSLEKRLREMLFDLWECPSNSNILEFIQLTYRFRELMKQERTYLERRLKTWQFYRDLLERRYNVKLNFRFEWGKIGFLAFIDLMKYLLWDDIIPECVFTFGTYNILRDVAKAKGLEMILNLLVHLGGITSLEKHLKGNAQLSQAIENYIKIWENGVPASMIRLP